QPRRAYRARDLAFERRAPLSRHRPRLDPLGRTPDRAPLESALAPRPHDRASSVHGEPLPRRHRDGDHGRVRVDGQRMARPILEQALARARPRDRDPARRARVHRRILSSGAAPGEDGSRASAAEEARLRRRDLTAEDAGGRSRGTETETGTGTETETET